MTSLNKGIVQHYLFLNPYRLWDDIMRRAVVTAKYKESKRWAES